MRPHRRGYPVASDTGFTKAVSVLKKGGTNTEIHRNVGTAQFGGGIDVHTRLKLLFPIGLRGEVRDYYTLKSPRFGVPIQRTEQPNVIVSGRIGRSLLDGFGERAASERGRSDAR